ncbi:WUSCHEL-related homeobox 3 [Manihot esculenta]|uniref:Uncharacterized protein n=2 Tax=Manihot esculenta TaxID=3983 RepID=A0ACB7HRA7_MANES|nr:WUSCHEL-related homeobox 3 [Manihot esculenta]KAG8655322.1 hypothetical protein MANES_04G028001v8 [Manihot esculenta]
MSPAASSRWSPTTEQLMILEELYKRGIIAPNASQIQTITAHLSLYGNIERKNVFYWFQNHKARDRQKFKRKLIKQLQLQLQQHLHPPPLPRTLSPFHPASVPQGGLEGTATQMMMNHPWKVEIPESIQMDGVGPLSACSSSIRSLETLELFPITATNHKEECNNNNNKICHQLISNDHFLSL